VATSGRNFLGAYRLVRLLRSSQTCQVWEAIHDGDRRRVALKALHDSFIKDKAEIAALKHEFTVASTFDHPNVIHIYEFDTFRNIPFLSLEFCISRNMKMAIREKEEGIAYWAPQIIENGAKALGYVHQKGWLHRDVKPDNFLLDEFGNIKLIDFSIAEKKKSKLSKLTSWFSSTTIQGTRSYIAPEQIRGQLLDERADIYSYGCTIYELIGGKLPFTADSPDHLLDKHLRGGVPSLQAANGNVTKEFSELVARMMAKDRERRPETMDAFVKLLRNTKIYEHPPRKPQVLIDREKAEAAEEAS